MADRASHTTAIQVTHSDRVERMLESYRDRIGMAFEDLPTPALVLDVAVLDRNIAAMQRRMEGRSGLRPHAKTHKSAEIAARQLEAGAVGVTTATAWEALALARAGITDILLGNLVRGTARCDAVAEVGRLTRATVIVDEPGNVAELAAAAGRAGVELDVLVDVDVGQHRTGVQTPQQAVEVAHRVDQHPELRLRGVNGYEGQVSREVDGDRRRAGAAAAGDRRAEFVDAVRAAGLPVEIVSGGGTGMWDSTGFDARVTQLQAGTYVFMDVAHWTHVPDPEPSLHVLATVMSSKGSIVILDTGRKTLGTIEPEPRVEGVSGRCVFFHEEHLGLETDAPPAAGSVVPVIPGYAPAAATLHEVYHVIGDGRVVDIWPVLARGGGREGAR